MKKLFMIMACMMAMAASVFAKDKGFKCYEYKNSGGELFMASVDEIEINEIVIEISSTSSDNIRVYVEFESEEATENEYYNWTGCSASEIVDYINGLFNKNPDGFIYNSDNNIYIAKFYYKKNK